MPLIYLFTELKLSLILFKDWFRTSQ